MQLATIESLGSAWAAALSVLILRGLWPGEAAAGITPLDVAYALQAGTACGIVTALVHRRRARASVGALGSE